MIKEIQAKTLLARVKGPDDWFGLYYNMNLYRGCQHQCIYCDSRSECYQIEDFEHDVLVKANAVAITMTLPSFFVQAANPAVNPVSTINPGFLWRT